MPKRTCRESQWDIVAIAAVGLLLRVVWVLAARDRVVYTDGQFYHGLAGALADGLGFLNPYEYARTGEIAANANHTPAWPLLLAVPRVLGATSQLSAQLFACLVGSATVIVVGLAGRAVAGRRAGLVAAAFAAMYPGMWVHERELMSETLTLPLMAVLVLVAAWFRGGPSRMRATLLGVCCGTLALTHPDSLLLLAFLVLPLIVTQPGLEIRDRALCCGLATLAVALVVSPWVIYNAQRFREPVFMTTAFGFALATGNCDSVYRGSALGSGNLLCPRAALGRAGSSGGDASEEDAVLRRSALRYAAENWARVPVVVAAREGRTWGAFRPVQQARLDARGGTPFSVEMARMVSYWLLAVLAARGCAVAARKRLPLLVLLAPLACVIVTTAVTFGDTRYRALAEVPLLILAGVAVSGSRT